MTMGGYKSVIITDTLQFFLIISLISAPFFLPMQAADYLNLQSLLTFPHTDKLALTVFGALYMLAMPEAWQRIYSAKDDRTIHAAFPLMNAFLIVMTLSLIWMGMGLRALPEAALKAYAEPYLAIFDPRLGISSWFLGYLVMTFLAITMSTQSAACYVFTATLNRLFLHRQDKTEAELTRYIRRSRWQMAALLALTAVVSLTLSDIVKFMFEIIGFFICLAPAYMLATLNPGWLRHWPARDKAISGVLLAGIALFIGFYIAGWTKDLMLSTVPALTTGLIVLGLHLYKKSHDHTKKTEHA